MPKKRATRGRRAALNKKAAAAKETRNVEEKVQGSDDEKNTSELSLNTEKDSLPSESTTPLIVIDQNEETKDDKNSTPTKSSDSEDVGKNLRSKNEDQDEDKASNVNEDDKTTSQDQPKDALAIEAPVKNTTKTTGTERKSEDNLVDKNVNKKADADFADDVEEAFIDNESDEDIQYIDEEVVEEKDQELCEVLEGQQEEDSVKTAKNRNSVQEKDNSVLVVENENNMAEDNNFELISEGSMDQLGQSEIIEAISDSEIALDVTDQDKGKDNYNEAAETLEQVFLATENENTDKVLVEDKDNDDISDASLCGDDDNGNLSLEEISDEELDSSKKKHPVHSDSLPQNKSDTKENAQEEEKNSETVEDDAANKKRQHIENDEDKDGIPSKKVKLGTDQTKKDNKHDEYGGAAFFTNISACVKSKEVSKPPLHNPPTMNYVQQSAFAKDLSVGLRIDISTQTLPLSKKGKIVQCNIRPISEEADNMAEKGRRESLFLPKLLDEYKSQIPSSISEVFQDITSTNLSEQGHYQFSLGPVTHADIDNSEFREISFKFVEKFQLSFNSKHQGIFTAQLQKQETVAHLIRSLKRLELGTRYMVFSVAYRHGPLSSGDSLWTASIVFMYSQDRQGEKGKFVSDGKERARMSVEGVPKGVSKDFIQMLFPESLYISTRLGPSLDKSLVLGYSGYLMVEETCTCYEMVLINGKKIAMSCMDPLKDITNTTQTDPGYIDENGIVLIPDSEVNMIEESVPPSTETDAATVKTNAPTKQEKDFPAQETPDDGGLPKAKLAEQKNAENAGGNVTSELVPEVIKETEAVTCSRNETEPGNTVAVFQDKEEKEATTKDSTEKEDTADEKHLAEKEVNEDLPTPTEVAINENSVKDTDVLSPQTVSSEDASKDKKENENDDSSKTNDQTGIEEKTKELSSGSRGAAEIELVKEGSQAEESTDVSVPENEKDDEQSKVVNDMEKGIEVEGEKVETDKDDEDGSCSKIRKDDTIAEEKCEKDTSLEDVSDDEIINNDSKAIGSATDDDVIILQEDPSKRLVGEIDLTLDADELSCASGYDTKDNKEKKKSEVSEKLCLTDGNFEVTMEAINVEEDDEPERIMYPRYDYSKYSKDLYQADKHRGTGPADSDAWQSAQQFKPGVRFVTRLGEVYIPKAGTKEGPPRYEYYSNESHKNYEQVSSVRSGSSVADVCSTNEGSGLTRPLKPKASIREKSSEHYDSYRREYRRSKSPSPRRDKGFDFERKTSQLQMPQRPLDHFQHPRQLYSKDFSHGYSYGSASSSNKGRGYSDWHSELSDTKRRDAYQPYEAHKSWTDGGYSKRKSPDHLPLAYDIKKSAASNTSRTRSRVSSDRRSPNRFRRTRSRSLSPLSDKSFSSSSQSSRNKRGRTNRSKASYKRISRSPISISSRSQSLSPVSKSPSPQRYSRSSLYKSRRDQYSPIDRKTSRTYTSKNRSRSRSPYWSKTKARSRSPSFKKDDRSPPYKRIALSPVTNRDKPMSSSSTKPSHATWQSHSEKNRTSLYEPDTSAGSQGKTKTVDIKSAPYGNYQQQGPPQGYGYPVAPINYNTPPPFAQWPTSSFPPPTGYSPQQTPVYTNSNPPVAAQYNYSGMPDYTNVNTYTSYSYNMPAPVNNPSQVPQPNYNPYTTSASHGISQSGTASSMMGMSSAKKSAPSSQSDSSKKWSMGQGGGALVFQRILSSVSKSKK